ncbi:MAG: hypothetical protein JST22_03635 [Bacteroidetes bacterium]|nr:hypothetical protein [Bacteroidota bacterium]
MEGLIRIIPTPNVSLTNGGVKKMSQYEVLSLIISSLGFGGAVMAIVFAQKQLVKAAKANSESEKANSISTLATVLQLEDIIGDRMRRIDEIRRTLGTIQGTPTKAQVDAYQADLDGAVHSYLNAMDRLCACFLRGTIPEDVYKEDYVELLPRTIETYEKYFGGVNNRYKNITDLRDCWRNQKPAISGRQ